MPLRSGCAARIALARSADFAWSPPPYWMSTISMSGSFSSMYSTKPSRRCCPVSEVWSCTTSATLPVWSIASAMCLAASAAAALLSVAAVVSGMSLSTPESNAMTGMPPSGRLLQQRAGGLAVERGESDRVGALVERGLQHLDLLVDVGLGVGALERHLDVELLGRLLGAGLHGLPELVLEALRDQGDVRLSAVVRPVARASRRRCSRSRPARAPPAPSPTIAVIAFFFNMVTPSCLLCVRVADSPVPRMGLRPVGGAACRGRPRPGSRCPLRRTATPAALR